LSEERGMVGSQERWQEELFVACSLRELIPGDHILRRVNKVLDLSWLRGEVKGLYDEFQGRPSIDPESAVRLMLAGFFQGIVHDRKLMREAQVNIAIRWFAGYKLHEKLPDHSSLSRIRRRWGEARFKKVFRKTVEQCVKAGLVDGETVHVDATLIRADVSWESLVERHAQEVMQENALEGGEPPSPPRKAGRPRTRQKAPKKISLTDPDATMGTSCNSFHMEPSFKQHTAVDDKAGVVVDVAVTTGEQSEGAQLLEQVERIEGNTGRKIQTLTADGGYAHSENYRKLEERGTAAVIPPQKEAVRTGSIPQRRFKYDAKNHLVKCPCGKLLTPSGRADHGTWYKAQARDCARCPLRARCFSTKQKRRAVLIMDGYEALLRARRKRLRWSDLEREQYQRHRWRVEGIHGEAKTQHGLRRAARRGLWNVAIQAYLAGAVMNLKRLAALLLLVFLWGWRRKIRLEPFSMVWTARRMPICENHAEIKRAA